MDHLFIPLAMQHSTLVSMYGKRTTNAQDLGPGQGQNEISPAKDKTAPGEGSSSTGSAALHSPPDSMKESTWKFDAEPKSMDSGHQKGLTKER